MAQWVKHLSLKYGILHSTVVYICTPSAPAMRWEAETGASQSSQAAGKQESLASKVEGEHWCLSLSSGQHTNKTDLTKIS